MPPSSAEPAFPGANPDKNWLNGAVYDANGNTLGLNGLGFLYDTENRMSAFATGSFYENYVYDESNHRVERSNNAGGANADLVYFYGPGGKLLTTFQITLIAGPTRYTATVQNQRVYFGGMLLGQTGTDYSHDVSTLTDRLGTAVPGYPYGTDLGTAAGADQPDFATYTKEGASGLEYANQRYYSAGYGRFMTVDRYGGSVHPGTPMSWNRYLYGGGDPSNYNDPSGNDICDGAGGDAGDYSYGQIDCQAYLAEQTTPPDPNPTWAIQIAVDIFTGLDLAVAPLIDTGGGGGGGGAPPQMECFAQLKYRPVDDPIAHLANATHSFWWVQGDLAGISFQDIISGGPQPYKGSSNRYLQAWVVPGSANGADNKGDTTAWSISGGASVCGEVDSMVASALLFPPRSIIYSAYPGPNSNSLAHFLAMSAGLSVTTPSPYSYGWDTLILPIRNAGHRSGGPGSATIEPIVPYLSPN